MSTRAKDPKIIEESQKVFKILSSIFIVFAFIMVGITVLMHSEKRKEIARATETFAPNWQLCWEKKPEHEGKTGMRNHCVPVTMEKRTSSHLIFAYDGNFGKGLQEGTSIDGVSYSGEWRDGTGWGKFHLRFTSSDTAFGWSDDEGKGEKIPNVLEKI